MRSKVKLRKQSILTGFLAMSAWLSAACSSSAPPPVPVSAPPANRAEQPNAPAAEHDHDAHESENKMPRLIPEELKSLVAAKQAVIVDVRSAEDYRQAHIEGAINLPLQQIESGDYPKLPRDKRLISYCT